MKRIAIREPSEAEVVDILEALRIYTHSFHESLIVLSNAITWVLQKVNSPWKLEFSVLNETRSLL